MTINEYYEEIEKATNYYRKKLTEEQHIQYFNVFKFMDKKQFAFIIAQAIKTEKYFPKISDLQNIKKNSKMQTTELVEKVDCKICKGNGFIEYTKKNEDTGYLYKYIARCTCKNGLNYSSFPVITSVTNL